MGAGWWTAVGGGVLIVLSMSFAWYRTPFLPPEAPSLFPDLVGIPMLVARANVRVPTIAHFLALGGPACILLAILGLGRPPAEWFRRSIGILVLIVLGLFVWRVIEAHGDLAGQPNPVTGEPEGGPLGRLGFGFYFATAGGLLTAIGGRWPRRGARGATEPVPPAPEPSPG